MKVGMILLSLLAATFTWWWGMRRLEKKHRNFRQHVRLFVNSFVAGVAVYFVLMLGALLYVTSTAS